MKADSKDRVFTLCVWQLLGDHPTESSPNTEVSIHSWEEVASKEGDKGRLGKPQSLRTCLPFLGIPAVYLLGPWKPEESQRRAQVGSEHDFTQQPGLNCKPFTLQCLDRGF